MSEFFRVKHNVALPEFVRQNHVSKNGCLEVNINSNVPAIQDFLIKMYYFDYLDFIFYKCKGRVFLVQLCEYMKKMSILLTDKKVQYDVDSMIYYKLLQKKTVWNSNLLTLTLPSINFFQNYGKVKSLKIVTDIGSLNRTAYFIEDLIMHEPEKRYLYTRFIQENNFFLDTKLQYMEDRLNIVPQKVIRNSKNDYLVTLSFLDLNQSKRPEDIREKILQINSYFNPEIDNVYFKFDFCCWNKDRRDFIAEKWDKYIQKYTINASRFSGIQFTDLNIERLFDYHAKKKGAR